MIIRVLIAAVFGFIRSPAVPEIARRSTQVRFHDVHCAPYVIPTSLGSIREFERKTLTQ
jgi:hypothetical protein